MSRRRLYRIETWDRERGAWVADRETWTNRDRAQVACNRRTSSWTPSVRLVVVDTGEVLSPTLGQTEAQRAARVEPATSEREGQQL